MTRRHTSADYHNFRDPIGCAWRMLRRGRRETIWPLVQAATALIAQPLDAVAAHWEPTDSVSPDSSSNLSTRNHPPTQILVVGPPRSGSTLLSQCLARHLNVSYFPNVSVLFPNAPIWSTRWWLKSFDFAPHSLKSFYGNTVGLRGINDGFHIWNRWFGQNRYRIEHQPTPPEVKDMRSFFATWAATFPQPLLNKNNRNIDGLESLSTLLPNAYFVVVQRDPLMIVQSLQQARRFIQGSDNYAWGLFGDNARGSNAMESICQQVAAVLKRTNEQLARIPTHRWTVVKYEEFCDAPLDHIERIRDLVPSLTARSNVPELADTLRASSSVSLSEPAIRCVQDTLLRYDVEPYELHPSSRHRRSHRASAQ